MTNSMKWEQLNLPLWPETADLGPKFRPGDRVIHARSSRVPKGVLGTVISERDRDYKYQVKYENCPNLGSDGEDYWISRESSLELA